MTHDPLCQVHNWSPLERELDGNFYCQCELIAKVRADERWATVESAVFVASQYGCDNGLLNALNAIGGEP